MKLIVGLGNPGERYERTRHNLGFMVVERFLKDFEPVSQTVWHEEPKFKSDIAEITWQRSYGQAEKAILLKPKAYMNCSGLAVFSISQFLKISKPDIWIIHDDIDLPLGSMKIRFGGASAGHKGVQSIINSLKTDKFWRFRLGIGFRSEKLEVRSKKLEAIDDYVLGTFKGQERGKVKDLIKRGSKAIETALEDSLEKAMNRFNA